MKIILGDFKAKVGSEKIIKPTVGNESLHQYSNDHGVRIVNFVTSKNLLIRSTKFLPPKHSYVHQDLSGWEDSQPDRSYIDRQETAVEHTRFTKLQGS